MNIEEPVGAGVTRRWQVSEVRADVRTAYQHLVIGTTAQGVSLFCDDERQSTEFSQLVYHEALLVPALLLASTVDRVLIVGSSEGVASQIAASAGAAVDHVDIDAEAVRLCAEHLPYGYSPDELARAERGDGPVRVHYADGWEYVRACREKYDIVVVDLPDEQDEVEAQHNRLYGTEFLASCRSLLTPGGVVAYQGGCPTLWRNATLVKCWRRFEEVFPAPVYFGSAEHEWAFFFGTDRAVPAETMAERLPGLRYRPETIDALAVLGATVPPMSLR